MFKFVVDDINTVPEEHRGLYEQRNGKWYLKIEGMPDPAENASLKQKVNEFRENNIRLTKQIEEIQAKLAAYDGFDPQEAAKLRETEQKLKDKQLIDAGRVDELIQIKVQEAVNSSKKKIEELENTLKDVSTKRDEAEGRFQRKVVEGMLSKEAAKHGIRAGAMEDVFSHAERFGWKLDETGTALVARDADGHQRTSTANPGRPVTLDEYFKDVLPSDKPFYFEGSAGGGASGGGAGRSGRHVKASDQQAIDANIEKIASGEIEVVEG